MVATSNWLHRQQYQFQVSGARDVQRMVQTVQGASDAFKQADETFQNYQESTDAANSTFNRLSNSVKTVSREAGDFSSKLRSAFTNSSDSSVELRNEIRGLTGAVNEFRGKQDLWASITSGKVNKAYRLHKTGNSVLTTAYAGASVALGKYSTALDVAVEGVMKYNSAAKVADKTTGVFNKSTEVLAERMEKGVNKQLIQMESNFEKVATAITASVAVYEGFKLQDTLTEAGRATRLLAKDQKVLERVATDVAVSIGRPYEKVIDDLQGALKIGFRTQSQLMALAAIGQNAEKLTGEAARGVIDTISTIAQVGDLTDSEMTRMGRAFVNVSRDSSTSFSSIVGDIDQFKTAVLNVPKEARANAIKSVAVTRAALSDAFADSGSFQDIFGSMFSFDQRSFSNVAKVQSLLASTGIEANMMEMYRAAQKTGDSLPVMDSFIKALGHIDLHSTKGRMTVQRLSEMFGVQTAEIQRLSEMQKQGIITLDKISDGFNEGWLEGKRFDIGLGEINNTLSEMTSGVSAASRAVVAEFGAGVATVGRAILTPFAGVLRTVAEWFHAAPALVKSAGAIFGVFFGGWLLKKIVMFTAVTLAAQGASNLFIASVNRWGGKKMQEGVLGFFNKWGAGLSMTENGLSKIGVEQRLATISTVKDTIVRKAATTALTAYSAAAGAAAKALNYMSSVSGGKTSAKLAEASSALAASSAARSGQATKASGMAGATLAQYMGAKDTGILAKANSVFKYIRNGFKAVSTFAGKSVVSIFGRVILPVLTNVGKTLLMPWVKWPLIIFAGFKILKSLFTPERVKAIFSGIGKAFGWFVGSLSSLLMKMVFELPMKLGTAILAFGKSIITGTTKAMDKHGGLGGAIVAGLKAIPTALKEYIWDPLAEGFTTAFADAMDPAMKMIASIRRAYADTRHILHLTSVAEYTKEIQDINKWEKLNTKAAETQAAAKAAATKSEQERLNLLKGTSLSDPNVRAFLRNQFNTGGVDARLSQVAEANKARRLNRLNTPLASPIYVGRSQVAVPYAKNRDGVPMAMPASQQQNLSKLEETSAGQYNKLAELVTLQREQLQLMARSMQEQAKRKVQMNSMPGSDILEYSAGVYSQGG